MKISASNLAWNPKNDERVRELFASLGVDAVEIAPTKIWPDLTAASKRILNEYRNFWGGSGIKITALQSLLFGLKDVNIFTPEDQPLILDRLSQVSDIAAELGAEVLVFGSPKNRVKGSIPHEEALEISAHFFWQASELLNSSNIKLCLEANPKVYGCDFISNASEAATLVAKVNHQHFGLHLDQACEELSGRNPIATFTQFAKTACHVHLTEPNLLPPSDSTLKKCLALVKSMKEASYSGYFSFEYLSAGKDDDDLFNLKRCLNAFLEDGEKT